ncbi:MAG: phosphate ABC transporter substrate-binding protein PstS [Chloroflexota bacterium]
MLKNRLIVLFALLVGILSFAGVAAQDMTEVPGSGTITGPVDGAATELNGAGATFPKPLYDILFAAEGSNYNTLTGLKVNYQAIGSSGGINGISDNSVDFGASDGPMSDDQLTAAEANGGPVLHIPATMGGVAITYNIPELAGKDAIKLTPENLVLIYLGDSASATAANSTVDKFAPLVKWNDERLVADNPDLANVDKFITVVHRAEGSGTSNIFTSYLSAVSQGWSDEVGAGNSVDWPTGIGARGNAGIAGNIGQTPYTIGYVEAGYALANDLPAAQIQNKAGNWVTPTQAAVSAAAAGVELPDDMRVKIVNADGADAYPIAGFTWLLIRQNQTDAAKATAVTSLLWWVTHDGQNIVASAATITDKSDPLFAASGYAPLPQAAITKAEALIKSITVDGKMALPDALAMSVSS